LVADLEAVLPRHFVKAGQPMVNPGDRRHAWSEVAVDAAGLDIPGARRSHRVEPMLTMSASGPTIRHSEKVVSVAFTR
jgi:hypothetical protein